MPLNEAVKIAQALKETEDEKMGNLYLNLGNSYVQTTDFNKAREYYNKALLIIQPEENASVEIQKIYNNIGYSYYRQEQYNDAFNYFHKSLKINNSNNIAIKSMSHLAQCYIGISEYDSAALFFDKAIRISTTNDNMFNQEYASVLQDYGQFLMEMGDEEEGISNIKKSHAIFSQQNDSRDNVASLDRIIGNHYLAKGQYEKALYHAQQALIALEPGFKDTLYLANPDIKATESPYELLGILALKAEAMAKFSEPNGQNKYLSGSIKTYNLISALFDILKTSYSYDESKLFLSVQSSLIFQNALSTAYELYNKESNVEMLNTAFMFSEKTKYSTLLEAYRESSLLNTTIPGKKIEELSSLKRMLEKANRELYEITSQNNNPDEEAINRINNRIFELNRRNDSLENIFKTNYPEYFYAKKQHPVINPQLIQNKLTNNQALIEYSLNDTVLISFCILHDKIYTQKTYINIQYIDSLRLSLNNHGFTNTTSQDFATYISSSYYLYDKLIAPYASYIDKKSLIIIPDSRLGYIPFEALITEKPTTGKKMDFRNLNYLIRTNAISYSYSSTLLFDKEHTPPGWRNPRVLAFAPEYKPGIAIDGEDFFLAPIPGVEDEVKHITTLFTGKALLKEQATEETFKEEAPQYDILHLAMHTIIDEKNPTYSKLIFTLPENPDKQNDGILYTSELFSMSLQSKMAVLSACQTGDGKLNKGEGILSLARGFFYSGVPSVVMTLWSVNDAQSAAIMSSFYTYLKKGYSKDKALRQAKLDLLDQGNPLTSHPRYWAGYVSIGEQSPIAKNRRTIVMVICIVLLAGAISFILVHRRKHK